MDAIVRYCLSRHASLLLALVLSGLAGAVAAKPAAVVAQLNEDADFLYSDGFLAAHPDQYYRLRGAQARARGDLAAARRYFRRAARHADKLSQAAYAEMLWNGEGGEPDRPLAYAWMDLAAERATPVLLARREHYWAVLTPQQRERAVRDGQAVYAEYADDVAKPRLERELRRARNAVTGSHLGRNGTLDVQVRTASGEFALIDGERYWRDRHWQPEAYWAFQDGILASPLLRGSVEVGPIDALEGTDAP